MYFSVYSNNDLIAIIRILLEFYFPFIFWHLLLVFGFQRSKSEQKGTKNKKKKERKRNGIQFLSVPPPERRRRFYSKQHVSARHKSAGTERRLHLRWLPAFTSAA